MVGKTNVAPFSPAKPRFKYTGSYKFIDDGNGQWRIKFLTSGTLTVAGRMVVDVFLVGAGGGVANGDDKNRIVGGGAGGYTKTQKAVVLKHGTYTITVGEGVTGADGQPTTAFGITAEGGKKNNGRVGGNGGSAGGIAEEILILVNGASDGGDTTLAKHHAYGQGTTTREFGEPSGALYSPGGAPFYNGSEGKPGSGLNGPNSGAGAGSKPDGHYGSIEAGFSGIAIIRRHKE